MRLCIDSKVDRNSLCDDIFQYIILDAEFEVRNVVDIYNADIQVISLCEFIKLKGKIGVLKRPIVFCVLQPNDDWFYLQWTSRTSKEKLIDNGEICYTDGSAFTKQAGAAACFKNTPPRVISETLKYSGKKRTNQQAEMVAIALAFENATSKTIQIVSDSRYGICVLSGLYVAKANMDIYIRAMKAKTLNVIHYCHVYAHNGNEYNEMADRTAKQAAKK